MINVDEEIAGVLFQIATGYNEVKEVGLDGRLQIMTREMLET